jgi:hypothetical protein
MKDSKLEVGASAQDQVQQTTESAEQQAARMKDFFVSSAKRMIAVRNKDREFHGLQREFMYAQAQMLLDYEKSKDIKHPRDVGSAREAILGRFLDASGYLPKKYSIANTSVRVALSEGFTSQELDLLILDSQTSIASCSVRTHIRSIRSRPPTESCRLNQNLRRRSSAKAFANIASYKRLKKTGVSRSRHERGFGIVFAYDSDVEWLELARESRSLATATRLSLARNLIVVLTRGFLFHAPKDRTSSTSWLRTKTTAFSTGCTSSQTALTRSGKPTPRCSFS